MRQVEGQMLNVMTYPRQSIKTGLLCEGVGGEGDMNPSKDPFGDKIAVGGRCRADGALLGW